MYEAFMTWTCWFCIFFSYSPSLLSYLLSIATACLFLKHLCYCSYASSNAFLCLEYIPSLSLIYITLSVFLSSRPFLRIGNSLLGDMVLKRLFYCIGNETNILHYKPLQVCLHPSYRQLTLAMTFHLKPFTMIDSLESQIIFGSLSHLEWHLWHKKAGREIISYFLTETTTTRSFKTEDLSKSSLPRVLVVLSYTAS